MLTKNDLSQIKTAIQNTIQPKIEALGMEIKAIKKNMATKDDLRGMATKDDLKEMATKVDLKNLEIKLLEKIEDSEMEIIETVDKHKEDKEAVEVLEKRVERLEDDAGLPPFADQ